ncbi:hypothetical protein [Phormidium sp. CCY1219]|uniref:hypothetical protein n=1 Tax=Phormidium sp. CCY1219 TaxID=2886104 RepID=UPI002D1F0CE1|nr:hypothetical protein [Phormidium sp. CCY1219]MEB3828231.1 hypothetical protein [Phormidium sp. CCY1219]
MKASAIPVKLNPQPPTPRAFSEHAEGVASLETRAIGWILLTLLLLLATLTMWVFSVWAEVATPSLLPTLWIFGTMTTLLKILTGVAGILAAITFVSYRAKVLRCGSSPLESRFSHPASFGSG